MTGKISTVKRGKKVNQGKIEKKDLRWHTRNRLSLVFGSNEPEELETYLYENDKINFQTINFHQAKSKAIEELLDNCIDEFYRKNVTEVHITLKEDGKTIVVEDNGVGFDVTKIEQVYTEFRTGSKFKDEDTDSKGFLFRTLGQNGVGASATCLTADIFKVRVRDYVKKKEKTVTFTDGALKRKGTQTKPFARGAGVRVEVVLSPEVYGDNKIDEQVLRKRIRDLAFNNPGLKFVFNKERYLSKKGLMELGLLIDPERAQLYGELTDIYETVTKTKKNKVKGKIDLSLSLIIDEKSADRERFVSFVNSTPTYDGGFHHDRVKRLFINYVKEKLDRTMRKNKWKLIDNDILAGMTFVLGIKMPNPRFESQTKRKLVRDKFLEKSIEKLMEDNIAKFLRRNKEYLEMVVERVKKRNRNQVLKDAEKLAKKSRRQKVEKLLDANEKRKRSLCTLFICEGDSAIGGLRSARDKQYQGGIALKGKPMNVSQANIKDVLNNDEFSDIMQSVGLVIGKELEEMDLRYSKIVFLADSDVDGGHINTLLANFFYEYFPAMFKEKMIYVAKAPLFEIITSNNKKIFAESTSALEKVRNDKRVKIKKIHRNKGLGEMSKEAFEYVLKEAKWTCLTMPDISRVENILEVCFGRDTQGRKDLLLAENSAPMSKSSRKKTTTKKKVTRRKTKGEK